MKLEQINKYFNPYYVDVNSGYRCISKICIFKNGEIIATNNSGWFGTTNRIPTMEIPVDCVMKRKVDLKAHTAFIIKDSEDRVGESRYILYIPDEVVHMSAPTHSFTYGIGHVVEKMHSEAIDGMIFEKHFFGGRNIITIESKIRDIGKKISTCFTSWDEMDSWVLELTSLKTQLDAEKERIKNLSAEEIIHEVNNRSEVTKN